MPKTPSPFLKVPEAAAAFGVSERTIRNWIHSGQLPAIQPAGPNHAVRVDGQTAADLEIARANLAALK
jgi:excisionase family DNA binding protein